MISNKNAIIRLYQDYTKRFLGKIIISFLLSLIVAGSTPAIAWLLDPAIKKLFIEKDQTLILIIPLAIILAFSAKGISLYLAKVLMIGVAEDIKKDIQKDMVSSLVKADITAIDNKHTGKFISNLTYDTSLIVSLMSTALLSIFKDSVTLKNDGNHAARKKLQIDIKLKYALILSEWLAFFLLRNFPIKNALIVSVTFEMWHRLSMLLCLHINH